MPALRRAALAVAVGAALTAAAAAAVTPAAEPAPSTGTAAPFMAMGLIPVEAGGALSMNYESFVVSPRQDGCDVRREIKIRCRGGTGTYRVAIALRAPDGSTGGLESTIGMSVDGVPQDLLIYEDGYDAGPGVWAELALPISRNATRTVDVYYSFRGDAIASAEFARAQLGIHTQTFWGNNVVSRIDARLALGGSGFLAADFEPRNAVSGQCVIDLQSEGGTLVWKVRSYRTATWNRSYTDWLVRPPGTPPSEANDHEESADTPEGEG
ncbi:MAG TPA: hypothetical protein VFP58_01135 [Candidatus Eisenbacteria bacterium]|nr:hypothetical protein [Candidatus Eisenbacteria bacterium]